MLKSRSLGRYRHIGDGMLGQPVIQFFPALLVLGDTDIGKLRVLDTKDGDGVVLGGIALSGPKFYPEQWFDTLGVTSMEKLVSTGSIIDIRENQGLNTLRSSSVYECLWREGPVLKGIVCVGI